MRNKIYLTLILVLTAISFQAQSLAFFVDSAIESHPEIRGQELIHQATEKQVEQFSVFEDPMLSAGYNVVPNSMEKFNVSLMQNFAPFGMIKHQKEAVRNETKRSDYDLHVIKKEIELSVSSRYFELYEAQQILRMYKENKALYQLLETLAQNALASSKGKLTDVLRAEIAIDNLNLDIELLQKQESSLMKDLNILVGQEATTKIITETPSTFDSLVEGDVLRHPELARLDYKIDATKETVKAIEKSGNPMLGIGVEYMRMEPNRNEWMPMVSLSLPIFRKKYKARIAETQLLSQAYQKEKEWVENKLLRERVKVDAEIDKAFTEVRIYEQQIQKSKQAKELLIDYYRTSGDDFQEIVRMQQEELNHRIQKTKAQTRVYLNSKTREYLNDTTQPSNLD